MRAAASNVVRAALHALEDCFRLYGPAGFRVWIFVVPVLGLVFVLDSLAGSPTWVSSLSLSLGAGGGLGLAWSPWKR